LFLPFQTKPVLSNGGPNARMLFFFLCGLTVTYHPKTSLLHFSPKTLGIFQILSPENSTRFCKFFFPLPCIFLFPPPWTSDFWVNFSVVLTLLFFRGFLHQAFVRSGRTKRITDYVFLHGFVVFVFIRCSPPFPHFFDLSPWDFLHWL